jgi:hypothetical protein
MLCVPGQRQPPRVATVTNMKLEDMKIAVRMWHPFARTVSASVREARK